MVKRLPIVYVRGYAGSTNGIDKQVDDPFYGFNDGATHVRVDGDGLPRFYQFESPLLRLMIDEGYRLLVRGDQQAFLESQADAAVPPESIWVYRFYDQAATTFTAQPHRSLLARMKHDVEANLTAPGFNIEEAARGLYDFIELIRARTGSPKVYLVAHSMGGLIARCMLQKVSQSSDPTGARRTPGSDLVDKLFTFGTPHGGIDFDPAAMDWAMEQFGPSGADIFTAKLMYGYLEKDATWGDLAPDDWDPRVVRPELFDPDRIFCLIGTDPADYGPVRSVVGPKSDGLVKIDNAYVRRANRAFVHRSHSGRYGEVNSEEGYQNLRRFLFGAYKVKVEFRGLELQRLADDDRVWQAEVRLAVRGLPIVMHEQLAAHYCPIQLDEELKRLKDTPDSPVPLATAFLLEAAQFGGPGSDAPPPRSRYTLTLRVFHLAERRGSFFWQHHLEQVADWEDVLVVDVGRGDDEPEDVLRAWMAWNSSVPGALDSFDPITESLAVGQRRASPFTKEGDDLFSEIALPDVARPILGVDARLRVTASRRE